ncbi:MAG: deoxyribose-phosphate aldolase [Methanobacteriaceae archaeon]|jgi:deoxyribose-phosphate aldolase|nr:deoxyribose-phosphate aldolase [Methanobacteriaceae archaeon]OPY22322.1 MAG: Deoxyribose-phosphate aldolase [Methanobacterium sp. PtaU1.Bin097]
MRSAYELAQMIDHTNLRPDATEEDIKRLCHEALEYKFRCVCVNPTNVSLAVDNLKGSEVGVCVVVGFPLGAQTSKTKSFEAEEAVGWGASEVDMVMNTGLLKSGKEELVGLDIQGVVESSKGRIVKVILETALLTYQEKLKACLIAQIAGARFVKTSTGFGSLPGATVEDVKLLRETVGEDMGVKASGGIRNLETALKMIGAGANRIGTSSGVQIMGALIH